MFYKGSEKLENTQKNKIPMTHNQGVAGSCPAGTTKKPKDFCVCRLFLFQWREIRIVALEFIGDWKWERYRFQVGPEARYAHRLLPFRRISRC